MLRAEIVDRSDLLDDVVAEEHVLEHERARVAAKDRDRFRRVDEVAGQVRRHAAWTRYAGRLCQQPSK